MIIVIGIAVYSYLDGQAFRNAAAGADRSRSVVEQTQELLFDLKDAEIRTRRGYLLTGDPRYLVAYNAVPVPDDLREQRCSAGRKSPIPKIARVSPP